MFFSLFTHMNFNYNGPLSFISLSHSDNQSESATKFYNSLKVDVGGGGGGRAVSGMKIGIKLVKAVTERQTDRISLNDCTLICEQVLFVYVLTAIPPRLSDPCNFITQWNRSRRRFRFEARRVA